MDPRQKAAEQFVKTWREIMKNPQKKEQQMKEQFWISLIQKVYGIEDYETYIDFELPVKLKDYKNVDAVIPEAGVMIEQKSPGKNLDKEYKQSDGMMLTPAQQLMRYVLAIGGKSDLPDWLIVSNFDTFRIYDMECPKEIKFEFKLDELPRKYKLMSFFTHGRTASDDVQEEINVDEQAGWYIKSIYNDLLKEYKNPKDPKTLEALNILCVRLVFCLYAEDAGLFADRQFHTYLLHNRDHAQSALKLLFQTLDTPEEERDENDNEERLAFPYVDGGLFENTNISIPKIPVPLVDKILQRNTEKFNWAKISPTVFGAIFEDTLNPETRTKNGMHYTSVENIHKVIDPLFLDELNSQLGKLQEKFKKLPVLKTLKTSSDALKLKDEILAFEDKLSKIKILDPACGSGNFLTESYISLRRIENQALELLYKDAGWGLQQQIVSDEYEGLEVIQVGIDQFYGLEINDFAVSVAKTALWIAESQMYEETKEMLDLKKDFLPLKRNPGIRQENSIQFDWNELIPARDLTYIIGNPPFYGADKLDASQKKDRKRLFGDKGGKLDYVACWFKKAADYIKLYPIRCALVATNSITQGQQAYPLWNLLTVNGILIDFAYKSFVWNSQSVDQAHVHCVIIGFSRSSGSSKKYIFSQDSKREAAHINGYLIEGPDSWVVKSRRSPLYPSPKMLKGIQPTDHGYLLIEDNEKEEIIRKNPGIEKWIRPFISGDELLNGENKWCFWLKGISPAEKKKYPEINKRVEANREWRSAQTKTGDAYKIRNSPHLMRPLKQFKENSPYLVVPRVSSENREYIPLIMVDNGSIPCESTFIILDADLYVFGVLISCIHMTWMRATCGRLESRYRYSSGLCYNTFPWPSPTKKQRNRIVETARHILDIRNNYPEWTLADLYGKDFPEDLRKAHRENDKAVIAAYGWKIGQDEEIYLQRLFKMYTEKIEHSQLPE